MRDVASLFAVGLILGLACTCIAQDAAGPTGDSTETDVRQSAETAAIRATEETFQAAFNKGDAEGVAAHWTPDGEYIDEQGNRLQGREQIANAYAKLFAANPELRISTNIESVRLVGAGTAIEDGVATTESSTATPSQSTPYTVVHVKRNGDWLMASVRDERAETSVDDNHMADLGWLIGTWVSENEGTEYEVTSRWIADKAFIEQSFSAQRDGQVTSSGVQIIGWDTSSQNMKSWVFTSDGGRAEGVWTPHETGWTVEAVGTLPDGTPTSAVNILTALDNDGCSWRSVQRTAGAFRVLDTDEVILRRNTATKDEE